MDNNGRKNKPAVFYSGNTVVRAGDIVCVRGEYFDLNWKAVISGGRKRVPAELLQLNRQSFKVQIPQDFAEGVYTLELEGEESLVLTLNTPRVRWMQGDEGVTATPDGWVRMQGECLRVAEEAHAYAVFTARDGTAACLFPQRIYDDYSAGFALCGLAEGEYHVSYCNGFASCDCGMLTVAPSPESSWGKIVYNVKEYGISGDSVPDCTEALNQLLARAGKEGGGIIYFPRGRYHLTGSIHIPRGIVMRGDGYTRTQLFWTDEWCGERVLEDGGTRWMPERLPDAMITGEGDFAIEGIEFAAARIGGLIAAGSQEEPVENVRIENVRVNIVTIPSMWHAQHHFDAHCLVVKEIFEDRSDLFRIWGSNVKICGCDLNWASRIFCFDCCMDHLLIQNVKFGGTSTFRYWMPMGTLHNAIIEDNEIHEWTTGCGGDNIYMARLKIQDVLYGDREAFSSDITTGIQYYKTAAIHGCSFTFPDCVDMSNARPGSKLCILSGTGAGQYRRVKEVNGQTVTIDSPFDVAPDEQSHMTVNYMFTNWYFSDITIDNAGMLQFYVAQGNTVVDGVKITRSAGIKGYGQFTYGGIQNNWYNSYINNDFSQGNHFHLNGWYDYHDGGMETAQRLPGYSFLFAAGRSPELVNLCCMMRGNRMQDDCLLYVYSAEEGSISDAVLDGNHSEDCRCGIYVEGSPERLLLSGNTFERTEEEIHYEKGRGAVPGQMW